MKNITSSVYNFEKLRQEGYLYVDKTEYIWNLINPAGESYFLSRPRRFGKSLTVSTLKAVFEGKKELFKGLAIYDKPYDWKPYPVVHFDFANCDIQTADELIEYLTGQLANIAHSFHLQLRGEQLSVRFENLISDIAVNGNVVIFVDEYDKPILNNIANPGVKGILNVLKGFYSNIKKTESKLRFVFVTGVSKFCHVSLFSDLNNLTDITMDARFATMFGYTQDELEANFSDRIAALAGDSDIAAYKTKIKAWYNGYRFEENAKTVYNPVSLAQFFENGGKFNNYWFSTGTPSFLMELTKQKNFDFEAALKNAVPQVAFSAFEIDNIDPLTLLLQTGYITIKDTEERFEQTWYFLDFPNREVAGAFSAYILNSYAGKTQTTSVQFTAEIATALLNKDLKKLRKIMEVFFAGIPYTSHKKQESTFQTIFFSIFRLLGLYIEAESATNDGRIDAVVQTSDAIFIFEFKLDNDPTA
ncbi:MAG: AAA family ATPase, partial [Lentisphaerae bacterium]|nr:AAA family ATPase [Lentisphaerota bacterium]